MDIYHSCIIRVFLHDFCNLELIRCGLYRIEVSCWYNSFQHAASSISLSRFQKSHSRGVYTGLETTATLEEAYVCPVSGSYYSKTLLVRYNDEEFDLSESVSFAIQVPHIISDTNAKNANPHVRIVFRVLRADPKMDGKIFSGRNSAFASVSQREVQIPMEHIRRGSSTFLPIVGESEYLFGLTTSIYSFVSSLSFRSTLPPLPTKPEEFRQDILTHVRSLSNPSSQQDENSTSSIGPLPPRIYSFPSNFVPLRPAGVSTLALNKTVQKFMSLGSFLHQSTPLSMTFRSLPDEHLQNLFHALTEETTSSSTSKTPASTKFNNNKGDSVHATKDIGSSSAKPSDLGNEVRYSSSITNPDSIGHHTSGILFHGASQPSPLDSVPHEKMTNSGYRTNSNHDTGHHLIASRIESSPYPDVNEHSDVRSARLSPDNIKQSSSNTDGYIAPPPLPPIRAKPNESEAINFERAMKTRKGSFWSNIREGLWNNVFFGIEERGRQRTQGRNSSVPPLSTVNSDGTSVVSPSYSLSPTVGESYPPAEAIPRSHSSLQFEKSSDRRSFQIYDTRRSNTRTHSHASLLPRHSSYSNVDNKYDAERSSSIPPLSVRAPQYSTSFNHTADVMTPVSVAASEPKMPIPMLNTQPYRSYHSTAFKDTSLQNPLHSIFSRNDYFYWYQLRIIDYLQNLHEKNASAAKLQATNKQFRIDALKATDVFFLPPIVSALSTSHSLPTHYSQLLTTYGQFVKRKIHLLEHYYPSLHSMLVHYRTLRLESLRQHLQILSYLTRKVMNTTASMRSTLADIASRRLVDKRHQHRAASTSDPRSSTNSPSFPGSIVNSVPEQIILSRMHAASTQIVTPTSVSCTSKPITTEVDPLDTSTALGSTSQSHDTGTSNAIVPGILLGYLSDRRDIPLVYPSEFVNDLPMQRSKTSKKESMPRRHAYFVNAYVQVLQSTRELIRDIEEDIPHEINDSQIVIGQSPQISIDHMAKTGIVHNSLTSGNGSGHCEHLQFLEENPMVKFHDPTSPSDQPVAIVQDGEHVHKISTANVGESGSDSSIASIGRNGSGRTGTGGLCDCSRSVHKHWHKDWFHSPAWVCRGDKYMTHSNVDERDSKHGMKLPIGISIASVNDVQSMHEQLFTPLRQSLKMLIETIDTRSTYESFTVSNTVVRRPQQSQMSERGLYEPVSNYGKDFKQLLSRYALLHPKHIQQVSSYPRHLSKYSMEISNFQSYSSKRFTHDINMIANSILNPWNEVQRYLRHVNDPLITSDAALKTRDPSVLLHSRSSQVTVSSPLAMDPLNEKIDSYLPDQMGNSSEISPFLHSLLQSQENRSESASLAPLLRALQSKIPSLECDIPSYSHFYDSSGNPLPWPLSFSDLCVPSVVQRNLRTLKASPVLLNSTRPFPNLSSPRLNPSRDTHLPCPIGSYKPSFPPSYYCENSYFPAFLSIMFAWMIRSTSDSGIKSYTTHSVFSNLSSNHLAKQVEKDFWAHAPIGKDALGVDVLSEWVSVYMTDYEWYLKIKSGLVCELDPFPVPSSRIMNNSAPERLELPFFLRAWHSLSTPKALDACFKNEARALSSLVEQLHAYLANEIMNTSVPDAALQLKYRLSTGVATQLGNSVYFLNKTLLTNPPIDVLYKNAKRVREIWTKMTQAKDRSDQPIVTPASASKEESRSPDKAMWNHLFNAITNHLSYPSLKAQIIMQNESLNQIRSYLSHSETCKITLLPPHKDKSLSDQLSRDAYVCTSGLPLMQSTDIHGNGGSWVHECAYCALLTARDKKPTLEMENDKGSVDEQYDSRLNIPDNASMNKGDHSANNGCVSVFHFPKSTSSLTTLDGEKPKYEGGMGYLVITLDHKTYILVQLLTTQSGNTIPIQFNLPVPISIVSRLFSHSTSYPADNLDTPVTSKSLTGPLHSTFEPLPPSISSSLQREHSSQNHSSQGAAAYSHGTESLEDPFSLTFAQIQEIDDLQTDIMNYDTSLLESTTPKVTSQSANSFPLPAVQHRQLRLHIAPTVIDRTPDIQTPASIVGHPESFALSLPSFFRQETTQDWISHTFSVSHHFTCNDMVSPPLSSASHGNADASELQSLLDQLIDTVHNTGSARSKSSIIPGQGYHVQFQEKILGILVQQFGGASNANFVPSIAMSHTFLDTMACPSVLSSLDVDIVTTQHAGAPYSNAKHGMYADMHAFIHLFLQHLKSLPAHSSHPIVTYLQSILHYFELFKVSPNVADGKVRTQFFSYPTPESLYRPDLFKTAYFRDKENSDKDYMSTPQMSTAPTPTLRDPLVAVSQTRPNSANSTQTDPDIGAQSRMRAVPSQSLPRVISESLLDLVVTKDDDSQELNAFRPLHVPNAQLLKRQSSSRTRHENEESETELEEFDNWMFSDDESDASSLPDWGEVEPPRRLSSFLSVVEQYEPFPLDPQLLAPVPTPDPSQNYSDINSDMQNTRISDPLSGQSNAMVPQLSPDEDPTDLHTNAANLSPLAPGHTRRHSLQIQESSPFEHSKSQLDSVLVDIPGEFKDHDSMHEGMTERPSIAVNLNMTLSHTNSSATTATDNSSKDSSLMAQKLSPLFEHAFQPTTLSSSQPAFPPTSEAAATGMENVTPQCSKSVPQLHLVVFLNGLGGSSSDLRSIRAYIKMIHPHLLCFTVTTFQGNDTQVDLVDASQRIAKELHQFIVDTETEEGVRVRNLSFVAFSLGGVVLRLALRHPLLFRHRRCFHALITLASPHLGLLQAPSRVVKGLNMLKRFNPIESLTQLGLLDGGEMIAQENQARTTAVSSQGPPSAGVNVGTSAAKPTRGVVVDSSVAEMIFPNEVASTTNEFNSLQPKIVGKPGTRKSLFGMDSELDKELDVYDQVDFRNTEDVGSLLERSRSFSSASEQELPLSSRSDHTIRPHQSLGSVLHPSPQSSAAVTPFDATMHPSPASASNVLPDRMNADWPGGQTKAQYTSNAYDSHADAAPYGGFGALADELRFIDGHWVGDAPTSSALASSEVLPTATGIGPHTKMDPLDGSMYETGKFWTLPLLEPPLMTENASSMPMATGYGKEYNNSALGQSNEVPRTLMPRAEGCPSAFGIMINRSAEVDVTTSVIASDVTNPLPVFVDISEHSSRVPPKECETAVPANRSNPNSVPQFEFLTNTSAQGELPHTSTKALDASYMSKHQIHPTCGGLRYSLLYLLAVGWNVPAAVVRQLRSQKDSLSSEQAACATVKSLIPNISDKKVSVNITGHTKELHTVGRIDATNIASSKHNYLYSSTETFLPAFETSSKLMHDLHEKDTQTPMESPRERDICSIGKTTTYVGLTNPNSVPQCHPMARSSGKTDIPELYTSLFPLDSNNAWWSSSTPDSDTCICSDLSSYGNKYCPACLDPWEFVSTNFNESAEPEFLSPLMKKLITLGYNNQPNGHIFSHFQHIFLLASRQDGFAPFHSCLGTSNSTKDNGEASTMEPQTPLHTTNALASHKSDANASNASYGFSSYHSAHLPNAGSSLVSEYRTAASPSIDVLDPAPTRRSSIRSAFPASHPQHVPSALLDPAPSPITGTHSVTTPLASVGPMVPRLALPHSMMRSSLPTPLQANLASPCYPDSALAGSSLNAHSSVEKPLSSGTHSSYSVSNSIGTSGAVAVRVQSAELIMHEVLEEMAQGLWFGVAPEKVTRHIIRFNSSNQKKQVRWSKYSPQKTILDILTARPVPISVRQAVRPLQKPNLVFSSLFSNSPNHLPIFSLQQQLLLHSYEGSQETQFAAKALFARMIAQQVIQQQITQPMFTRFLIPARVLDMFPHSFRGNSTSREIDSHSAPNVEGTSFVEILLRRFIQPNREIPFALLRSLFQLSLVPPLTCQESESKEKFQTALRKLPKVIADELPHPAPSRLDTRKGFGGTKFLESIFNTLVGRKAHLAFIDEESVAIFLAMDPFVSSTCWYQND